jgi:hypothetical protein
MQFSGLDDFINKIIFLLWQGEAFKWFSRDIFIYLFMSAL